MDWRPVLSAGPCRWYNKNMGYKDNRVSDKRVVAGAPIVLSENNEELIWMSPNSVIIKNGNQFTYDKYLSGTPFKLIENDLLESGEFDSDDKDTVQLTDIESIVYESYALVTGEIKYRAILKIRNSSKYKEDVIGVDARTANLSAKE